MLFSLVVDDSQRKWIQIIECNLNKKSEYKILNQLSYFGQLLDICERLHLSLEGAEESHVVRLLQQLCLNRLQYCQSISEQNLGSLEQESIPDVEVSVDRESVNKQAEEPVEREESWVNTMLLKVSRQHWQLLHNQLLEHGLVHLGSHQLLGVVVARHHHVNDVHHQPERVLLIEKQQSNSCNTVEALQDKITILTLYWIESSGLPGNILCQDYEDCRPGELS